jgi:hypothetical protein
MKPVKAFARFSYDFIIGDDWKIAVAVSSALAVLIAVMQTKLLDDHGLAVLGGAPIILFFAASLAIDVHPRRWTGTRSRHLAAQRRQIATGLDGARNANHDRGGAAQGTQPAARSFLLQRVQPAMTGLIDGSLSTLAPIFSVAIATHNPHTAFIAGTATALGAGVSMAFSEGLSDTGDITGRGNPYLRGSIAGLGTFLGRDRAHAAVPDPPLPRCAGHGCRRDHDRTPSTRLDPLALLPNPLPVLLRVHRTRRRHHRRPQRNARQRINTAGS